MKQLFTKLNVFLFCLLLAAFAFIALLAPKDNSVVRQENRELAPMPALTADSLFSGSFSRDFEDYLADHTGYRSFFTNAAAWLESLKGVKSKDGRMVTASKDLGTGDQGDNHLLVLSDRVMEVYRRNDAARDAYVNALNSYADALPEHMRLISMLIPTQIEFYEDQAATDSQKETIDYIGSRLNSRFLTIPVYEALEAHKDEYIYFRTDHHWSQLGAFYGYAAYAQTTFGQLPQLSDYETVERKGFLGYLYNQANDVSLKKHADTLRWYTKGENLTFTAKALEDGEYVTYSQRLYAKPAWGKAPKYSVFMGGDHQFAEIQTENKNGKTLLVMKDSYANALLPFLAELYETVLVIDPRRFYSTVSALTEAYEIDDCLFINYVFTTTFPDFIGKMVEIQ